MQHRRVTAAAAALAACLACSDAPAPRGAPTAAPVTTPSATASATGTPASPAASGRPSLDPQLGEMPTEFYGVLRGRIAAFDSMTGKRLRWLTDPPAGTADSQPVGVEDDKRRGIVFVRTREAKPCGTAQILRVPLTGGTPAPVYRFPPGIALAAATVDPGARMLAYSFVVCGGDGLIRVRVVGLSDGRVVVSGRSHLRRGGVVSVPDLDLTSGDLLLAMAHQRTQWLARLPVTNAGKEVNLDELPRLRGPAGCRPGSVVWTPQRRGLYGSVPALHTTLLCDHDPVAGTYVLRRATEAPGDVLEAEPPFARSPEFYDVTGSDLRGHLIGVRGTDQGNEHRRQVFQSAGTAERLLPGVCTDVAGPADACVTNPFWF